MFGFVFRNFKASLGFASITCLIILLLGSIVLLKENLSNYEQNFRENLKFEVFLKDDTTPDQLHALVAQIKTSDGFRSFVYREKHDALVQMQQSLGKQLLPDSTFNPFPNSISVSFLPEFVTAANLATFSRNLEQNSCVEGINYGKEELNSQERVLAFFRLLSTTLTLISIIAMAASLNWGLRREMESRTQEIRVLKLLGAGWREIGMPLMTQGIALGVVFSASGLFLLYVLWRLTLRLPLQLHYVSMAGLLTVVTLASVAGAIASWQVARRMLK